MYNWQINISVIDILNLHNVKDKKQMLLMKNTCIYTSKQKALDFICIFVSK